MLVSCQQDDSNKPLEDEDVLLGGATSIDGAFINIFQQPAGNLNEVELQHHLQSIVIQSGFQYHRHQSLQQVNF